MKLKALLIASSLAFCASMPAGAQFAKPEDAIKYRQSALFVMGQNFIRVAAMANGRVPFDAKVAVEKASVAAYMARLPWAGFTPDSDMGNTKAKPEIWSNKAKFDDLAKQIVVELDKLEVVAKAGNIDAIKASVGAVNKACKNCHDDFRAK